MDKSSCCGTFDSEIETENAQFGSSSRASLEDHNITDITGLSGKLMIDEGNQTNTINDMQRIPVEKHHIVEEEEDEEDDLSDDALLDQMGYGKSEPTWDYADEDDLSENSLLVQMGHLKNEPPKHEPITTPIADLNIVSALKGSREKEGKPPKECRVSWAPEVCDPPCTSDEHFAPNKTEKHRSELKAKGAAGRNKKKSGGKGVGGSVGGGKAAMKIKDKKKADKKMKKRGGTSSKYSDRDDD